MGSVRIGLLILIWLLPGWAVMAQGGGLRERADRSIRQTSIVLAIGRQTVKKNKVYTGDLAKAHNHQEYAMWLYRQSDFVRSIYHTRRARKLAGDAIRANRGEVQQELLAEDGLALPGTMPSDSELDQELAFNFSGRVHSDEEACQLTGNSQN